MYADWPSSIVTRCSTFDQPSTIPKSIDQEEQIHPRGMDWALLALSCGDFACNTFRAPGLHEDQQVTGYLQTQDLDSGEVWVCAGISGIQSGFLSGTAASNFDVRSISLEHPLGMYTVILIRLVFFLMNFTKSTATLDPGSWGMDASVGTFSAD